MAAIRAFGLRDLLLPPKQTDLPDSEIVQIDPAPVRETISLSGYMNTPESRALAEWMAFLDRYDRDDTILHSVGNHQDKELRPCICYLVYYV